MGGPFNAIDQIATLLAQLDSETIKNLRPSEEDQKRIDLLLKKSKNGRISEDEQDELRQFLVIERIVRMAKLKAA
jgi:hypothetical protein